MPLDAECTASPATDQVSDTQLVALLWCHEDMSDFVFEPDVHHGDDSEEFEDVDLGGFLCLSPSVAA